MLSEITHIKQLLNEREDLRETLHLIDDYLSSNGRQSHREEAQAIKSDYELMLDFMSRGLKDPQRDSIYRNLLQRTYHLVQTLQLNEYRKGLRTYANMVVSVSNADFSHEAVKHELESFVADAAIIGLEPEPSRDEHKRQLYQRHYHYVSRLFDYIMVSQLWNDDEEERRFYHDLILSPTIDGVDALLLVSAISLSCINLLDSGKLRVLCDIYCDAQNERLRQRALTGWALSLNTDEKLLLPCQLETWKRMTASPRQLREVFELQKQMVYCINAERDNKTIQEDIMPKLLNNSNLNITKSGISEKEPDTLNDILHPDADDKAMDELERTMQKMRDMEQAGTDIYFGGFKHMKRFSFFYTLSNWFVPFFQDHPDLNKVNERLGNSQFLQLLFSQGSFCDSDKYSFALAMSSIIDQIPANMREMLNSEEAVNGLSGKVDVKSPAYIRRMYLQDLYRFFLLYSDKDDFCNPFYDRRGAHGLNAFVALQAGSEDADTRRYLLDFLSFIYKHGGMQKRELQRLFDAYADQEQVEYLVVRGLYELRFKDRHCLETFGKALQEQPDNEAALKGMGKSDLLYGDGTSAVDCYRKLSELHPDKTLYALNLCVALIKTGQGAQAMGQLYKMNYENPDNQNIIRVLSWGLLNTDKLPQAQKEYDKLLASDKPAADDLLNAGYCYWCQWQVGKAVELFAGYQKMCGEKDKTLQEAILEDWNIMEHYGLCDTDRKLMMELVERKLSESKA